jgi:hypothetical protein
LLFRWCLRRRVSVLGQGITAARDRCFRSRYAAGSMGGRLICLVLCVGVAAVIVLPGCGGSSSSGRLSKAEYQAQLQAIAKRMSRDISPGASAPSGTRVRAVVVRFTADLEGLLPPENAKADHQKLVDFLRFAAPFVPKLARAETTGNADELLGKLLCAPQAKAAEGALDDLQGKGYRLGELSSSLMLDDESLSVTAGRCLRFGQHLVPPRGFSVLSSAGTQQGSHLEATAEKCPLTRKYGVVCSTTYTRFHSPAQLTVIRPAETVRLLPSNLVPAHERGLLDVWITHLCPAYTLRDGQSNGNFDTDNTWTVHLPPGDYAATISFDWQQGAEDVSESGVIGLRVSRTAPRRIVRASRCDRWKLSRNH